MPTTTNTLSSSPPAPTQATGAADLLLTDKEVAAVLGVAVSTFRRHVTRGLVPSPIKLGGASRWPTSQIFAVIETAKARRVHSFSGEAQQ